MIFKQLNIEGIYLIESKLYIDNRGLFIKVFNFDIFNSKGLDTDFKENYFSISKKDVIRGMHFQTPKMDHSKIVYVSKGKIIDVMVDIRKHSPTYGKYITIDLSLKNGKFIYIPRGIAHGFLSLENNTIVNYMQTSCYSVDHDTGINYNSFGYHWENIVNPIISERDMSFKNLNDFITPFIFGINC